MTEFRLSEPISLIQVITVVPDEAEPHPYSYNYRGNLVYDKYTFSKTAAHGTGNIVYWRCTGYRKHKCRATLKTRGKELIVVRQDHNHEPFVKGSVFTSDLPIWKVRFSVLKNFQGI